jgi:SagB-type dehydrogenase family enzyme
MMIKRNPFMRLRFTKPPQLDLLLENSTFEVLDHDVVRAIVLSESETSVSDLLHAMDAHGERQSRQSLIQELLQVGILVEATYRHPLQSAAEHWQQRGWLDALVLHLRSRDLPYHDFGIKEFIRPIQCKEIESAVVAETAYPQMPDPRDIRLDRSKEDPFIGALQDIMYKRRSGQPWTNAPIDALLLGDILYSSNGDSRRNRRLTHYEGGGSSLFDRSSYSALETYVIVNKVGEIPRGVYAYSIEHHSLSCIFSGDVGERLVDMCIGQGKVRNCAVAFIIGAHWRRYMARYRHARAYRNLLINTAELAHCYILTATAAKLSNFITPAFNDEIAEELLGQRVTEVGPLYLVAIG